MVSYFMPNAWDENRERIMKLEGQMTRLDSDVERLEKSTESINKKMDKILYSLIAILALSNPLTADIAKKFLHGDDSLGTGSKPLTEQLSKPQK